MWGPDHPLFPVVLFVAYAIEDIGAARMDEAQRSATLKREGFSEQPGARLGQGVATAA